MTQFSSEQVAMFISIFIAIAGWARPFYLKFLDKKDNHEKTQSSKIACIEQAMEDLKKDIALLQSEKVSYKDLNKMLDRLETNFNKLQTSLAKIEGKLEK